MRNPDIMGTGDVFRFFSHYNIFVFLSYSAASPRSPKTSTELVRKVHNCKFLICSVEQYARTDETTQFGASVIALTEIFTILRFIQGSESELKLWPIAINLVSLMSSVTLCLLIYLEYRQHGRPSDLITLYLLGSVTYLAFLPALLQFDLVKSGYSSHTVVKIFLQLTLLGIGSGARTVPLNLMDHELSPESTSGILGRTLFLWMNSILAKAAHRRVEIEDLPCLDDKLSSAKVEKKILKAWESRGSMAP